MLCGNDVSVMAEGCFWSIPLAVKLCYGSDMVFERFITVIGITEGSTSHQVSVTVFNTDAAVREVVVQLVFAEQETGLSVGE